MKHRKRKKLIAMHQEFVNKYLCSRYNPGIYRRIYFCEDEDIAIVARVQDYDEETGQSSNWGCVNMAHQLLVPFEYDLIEDFGRFLIAYGSGGSCVYNKKGQKLYEIDGVYKTKHQAYTVLSDTESGWYRLVVRKMAISKSVYSDYYILDNGLVFLQTPDLDVGLILFSKLKLPFEYMAIAIPQNGYTLAIKESAEKRDDCNLFDCLLIKVRNQIKKEDSIHPTGISLFTGKSWDEVTDYFADKEQFEKECNSIVCYNEKVKIDASKLAFFPYDPDMPHVEAKEEDSEEEKEDYNSWSRENYSYEEAMYDALGGEMEAIWNID